MSKGNLKIEVVPYNPEWETIYNIEAELLKTKLGRHLKAIHHFGSTSIKNMAAKPVIDIMLECADLSGIEMIMTKLQQMGYEQLRRSIIPHRMFFARKITTDIAFHLHILEVGDPQVKRHINFRDYLTYFAEDAKNYQSLKKDLAQEFVFDRSKYVIGKDKFVKKIDHNAKLWARRRNDFLPQSTGKPAKQRSPEEILIASEANMNVHMTHFAQYLHQVELIRIPGYTLVNSGLDDDTFNYILDAHFSVTEVETQVASVTEYFHKKQKPFSWWISPKDEPQNLIDYLRHAGYQTIKTYPAMYFDLDAWDDKLQIQDLEIVRAVDKQALRDFALVLTNNKEAYAKYFSWIAEIVTPEDPVEYYVGYVNGKPVVRGLSCYYAGVVGLYWLSTAPDARKKGYATAMQQFRLNRAKALGYHVAVIQATEQGFPLYKRLGYKEYGIFYECKLT